MQRRTWQRSAILAAIESAGRPLTPKEIHLGAAGEAGRELNLATVYRNLKAMVDADELVAVEVLGQPPRYESPGLAHHHHFLCRACDRLFDIPGCSGAVEKLAPRGFRVEGHEVVLAGVCDECD